MLSTLVESVDDVLIWFAGKDLMAGLGPWLVTQGIENPGAFRAKLRTWLGDHPDDAPVLLPEWRGLISMLRA